MKGPTRYFLHGSFTVFSSLLPPVVRSQTPHAGVRRLEQWTAHREMSPMQDMPPRRRRTWTLRGPKHVHRGGSSGWQVVDEIGVNVFLVYPISGRNGLPGPHISLIIWGAAGFFISRYPVQVREVAFPGARAIHRLDTGAVFLYLGDSFREGWRDLCRGRRSGGGFCIVRFAADAAALRTFRKAKCGMVLPSPRR
jgi:hypothetical protein